MATLETYVPVVKTLDIAGKSIAITPLRVRQVSAFAAAITPCAGLILGGNVLRAMSAHGDSLITAIAVATNEPPEWLGDLLPDDFVRLVTTVLEVNADFFMERVTPALTEAENQLQKFLIPTSQTNQTNGAISSPT